MTNPKLAVLIAALAVAAFLGEAIAQNEPAPAPQPPSSPWQKPFAEQATEEAWTAFKDGQYEAASVKAGECIAKCETVADQIEATLESARIVLPKGAVSQEDRKRIARYQVLHDVATCLWIKGQAEEKLGHQAEAKKAYTQAIKYSHARSSRPTGDSFWSPAEKAAEALAK
ncbi:MAG: hypothetical protein HY298_08495 [Verrucomicrobia bacterium]|nr:hypothetical protein [Verrucomicrobiota bacterium]